MMEKYWLAPIHADKLQGAAHFHRVDARNIKAASTPKSWFFCRSCVSAFAHTDKRPHANGHISHFVSYLKLFQIKLFNYHSRLFPYTHSRSQEMGKFWIELCISCMLCSSSVMIWQTECVNRLIARTTEFPNLRPALAKGSSMNATTRVDRFAVNPHHPRAKTNNSCHTSRLATSSRREAQYLERVRHDFGQPVLDIYGETDADVLISMHFKSLYVASHCH